jgi:short-subunit dehydrogenase
LNGLSLTARNELTGSGIAVSVVYPYITRSDFYKNMVTAGPRTSNADDYATGRPPADTSEHVAGLILDVIQTGDAEIFAHDWMNKGMK